MYIYTLIESSAGFPLNGDDFHTSLNRICFWWNFTLATILYERYLWIVIFEREELEEYKCEKKNDER